MKHGSSPRRYGTAFLILVLMISSFGMTQQKASADERLNAAASINGLKGEYFLNSGAPSFNFGELKSTVVDANVDFNDLLGTFNNLTGRKDQVSVRWTGFIQPKFSEDYTFSIIGDNGFRLWVDNNLIVDHWVDDWEKEQNSAPVSFTAGSKHTIKLEMFQNIGGANLHLKWSSKSTPKQAVPAEAFFVPDGFNPAFNITKVTSPDVEFMSNKINNDQKTIEVRLSQYNSKKQMANVKFTASDSTVTTIPMNLTQPPAQVSLKTASGDTVNYQFKAFVDHNPALPATPASGRVTSLNADPDVLAYNGKYYIYSTTDGLSMDDQKYFRVYESSDMMTWTDKGIAFDVDDNKNDWARYSAWAPTVARGADGKFYMYFAAKPNTASRTSAIGVAVADTPIGPFKHVTVDRPLVTVDEYDAAVKDGDKNGQAIDPELFIDDDGTPYLYLGNYDLIGRKMNKDMISFPADSKWVDLTDSIGRKTGQPGDFCEGIYVNKRNGRYYFSWSSNGTFEPSYMAKWGTSDSPLGVIQYKGVLVQRKDSLNILATGHHSILKIPNTDRWYIVYHRFAITGGGREVVIDRLYFDANGDMMQVTPTLEGISEPEGGTNPGTGTNAGVLSGPSSAAAGQSINLIYSVNGVSDAAFQTIYGLDMTLSYDAAKFDFVNAASTRDTIKVVDQKTVSPGTVRIIIAGVNGGTQINGDWLKISLTAKPDSSPSTTSVSVKQLQIANGNGNELTLGDAVKSIQIGDSGSGNADKTELNNLIAAVDALLSQSIEDLIHGAFLPGSKQALQESLAQAKKVSADKDAVSQQINDALNALKAAKAVFDSKKINADLNASGTISVGDLAVIAAHYGQHNGDQGWEKKADLNQDGVVDIKDLSIAAKSILL